jgi:hypothetical protein
MAEKTGHYHRVISEDAISAREDALARFFVVVLVVLG